MSSTTGLSEFQIAAPSPAAIDLPAPYPPQTTFPLTLTPSKPDTPLPALLSELQRLSASGAIRSLLTTHGGAIHFRALPLSTADHFSQFAHAFNWAAHEDIGNPVRRTVLAPNVATANEGPPSLPIYPHNEFGLSPHHPAYVLFFCLCAPASGGKTPVNSSVVLYERLAERHPEFLAELERRGGVRYQLFFRDAPRGQTDSPGSSVLQAWGRRVVDGDDVETVRGKVEAEIRRLPTATWEWEGGGEDGGRRLGDLRVWQRLPAVRKHPHTGQLSFFNNTVSRYLNALAAGTLLPPHVSEGAGDGDHPPIYGSGAYQPPAFYGDGSLIPREYFDSAVQIINETRSLVEWTEGDVLLLDNFAVQHGREPWTGERKLLASLWDEP